MCSNLRVVTEVAKSLVFSSKIQGMADRIIKGMTRGGQEDFNAVHLRIEKDARDWSTIMGGEAVRSTLCFCVCGTGMHQDEERCGESKLWFAGKLITDAVPSGLAAHVT